MFYIWLNWLIWTQPTMNDKNQTYIINDQTKKILKGDVDGNGIGIAIISEIIYNERFRT
jgi:hypothetical protein